MSDTRLQERIDALETRIAYQDDALETLNAVVLKQWQAIDALRRELAELTDRLRDAEAVRPVGPANEPPPHY